ncbi:helix-turn-helix domain-containing protein [Actinosynnema sp. NPDC059335]|uniref:helix-turn-helix domain-containing protein n=1 Tax=Actinosynnema sp. NPDC059335 TaxID=3346804 RepID=UPI0036716003
MDGDGEPAGDRGRGVLEGAFRLLDVLSRAPAGAGLSEVSRDAGLPKASAYRLLEQLVDLAAVQRDDRRYFVGPHLARLGGAWQPHPVLERAAREPVRLLSAWGSSAALVTVLRENRVRAVSATRGAVTEIPRIRPYDEFPVRSAAGRLLLLGSRAADGPPPPGFGEEEWRSAAREFRRTSVVVDHQDVLPGVCCVAAPVRGPAGEVVAAVSALVVKPVLPAGLTELVVRAARDITRNLGLATSVR